MTKEEFKKFCKKYIFEAYTDIKSNDKHAYFSNLTNWPEKGYIYLWSEEDGDSVTVVYVGKAGKTMKDRCIQHLGGFKGGSKKGEYLSDKIVAGCKKGKCYRICARLSDKKTIVDEEEISMCDVEEKAFIKKLDPSWNKMGRKARNTA